MKQGYPTTVLPDYYESVARDMVDFCGSQKGKVWVDLGSGNGEIGLAVLNLVPCCVMIMLDPNEESLLHGLKSAEKQGVSKNIVPIIGTAEKIPMSAESVDVIVSRGSFFFWKDRISGLKEVKRILRPGGKAMIGGGLGSRYPQWARQEFIRRQRKSNAGKSSEEIHRFKELRSPETFRNLAFAAEFSSFEIVGEGGLDPNDPKAGIGIWLRFTKEIA